MEDSNYFYYAMPYEGKQITFRQGRRSGVVQMKLDDAFAQANGYSDREAAIRSMPDAEEVTKRLGMVPEWITITPDMQFGFFEM